MAYDWEHGLSPSNSMEREFGTWLHDTPNDATRGKCRAMAWRFGPQNQTEPAELGELRDLQDFLGDDNWDPKKGKEVIILEDMEPGWLTATMLQRHVPPHVFALHWAGPAFYPEGQVRLPLGQDFREHFVLSYDQYHPIKLLPENKPPKDGRLLPGPVCVPE